MFAVATVSKSSPPATEHGSTLTERAVEGLSPTLCENKTADIKDCTSPAALLRPNGSTFHCKTEICVKFWVYVITVVSYI